jgi:hypothetical protein
MSVPIFTANGKGIGFILICAAGVQTRGVGKVVEEELTVKV